MSDFTLNQVRYFVAAAATGSMTSAATELYIAPSAVSSAIAALEKSLGVQLFIRRHARGLTLTTGGEKLYAEARALLSHAAEFRDYATGEAEKVTGSITLGCFVTLAPFVIPLIYSASSRRYPQLDVRIIELETLELIAALQSGSCELALMYDFDFGDKFTRTPLGEASPYIIVSTDHPLASSAGIHLSSLKDEPLILLDIPRSAEYFEKIFADSGIVPNIRYRSSSYETVRGLVAEGQGYAILNQRPAYATTYGGSPVVTLPIIDELKPLALVMVRPSQTRNTGRTRALEEVCKSTIPILLNQQK